MAKYKVEINSSRKIEELLQETYDLTAQQLKQLMEEMNKLTNSVDLANMTMGEKSAYNTAITNLIKLKDISIQKRLDMAKLMVEIVKHNGNIKGALNDPESKQTVTSLNLDSLRATMDATNSPEKESEDNSNKIEYTV